MSPQTIWAELMHGTWALVALRRDEPDNSGNVTFHATADVPAAYRALAAEHSLPMTYELRTTIDADAGQRGQWQVDLLVCDVMADMRRDLHRALRVRKP